MKGIICFFSNTGNTKLACQYIRRKISSIEFEFCDIMREPVPDFSFYNIAGFATYTNFFGPPYFMKKFIEQIPVQENKKAFLFVTYGSIPGRTIKILGNWIVTKGFDVIAGHSLHTPENYPPLINKGITFVNSPTENDLKRFNDFISKLNTLVNDYLAGKKIKKEKLNTGIINNFIPMYSFKKAKKEMGEIFLDQELCNSCGICKTVCPYSAIEMKKFPVFDDQKCNGCWSCYNHCKQLAIYTKKIRKTGQYFEVHKEYKKKLINL